MSQLTQIRSIIQDKGISHSESLTLGTLVQLTYFPLISSSLVVSGSQPAYTVDVETGLVTFASAPSPGSATFTYKVVMLSDDTLNDIIDVNGTDADIRFMAADALDSLATNQALILKKIRMLDLDTDGPSVAKALREHSDRLREQTINDPSFEIAEQVNDRPGFRERILKEFMREGM